MNDCDYHEDVYKSILQMTSKIIHVLGTKRDENNKITGYVYAMPAFNEIHGECYQYILPGFERLV